MRKQLIFSAMLGVAAILPTVASADGYYAPQPAGPVVTFLTLPFVAAGVALNTAVALATAPFTGRFEGPLGPAIGAPAPVAVAPAPRPSYYYAPPAAYAPAPSAYYSQPAPVAYYAPRVAYRPYYSTPYYGGYYRPAPVYYAPRY